MKYIFTLLCMFMCTFMGCPDKKDSVPTPVVPIPTVSVEPSTSSTKPDLPPLQAEKINWVKDTENILNALSFWTNDYCILIYFRKSPCKACDQYEAQTLSDSELVTLINERFVAIKPQKDLPDELQGQFEIEKYPALALIPPGEYDFTIIREDSPSKNELIDLINKRFSECNN